MICGRVPWRERPHERGHLLRAQDRRGLSLMGQRPYNHLGRLGNLGSCRRTTQREA